MNRIFMFAYSVIAYLAGFVSLLYWILSLSNLLPEISIDRSTKERFAVALVKNLSLVLLFAIPHSVMARAWFKNWITKFVPKPIERSTYILTAGILLAILVRYWEPMGGTVWNISPESYFFHIINIVFLLGWIILFLSTFLINHFDLFGLRQTYLELTGKPYTPLKFRVVSFYKYVRHPLYFGGIVGMWATPVMTVTHLVFAILLTAYFVIGARFEERDLISEFGDQYKKYREQTPMFLSYKNPKE